MRNSDQFWKQNFLPGFAHYGVKEFGGSSLSGNAREARPVSNKRPMHLVMRSTLAVRHRSFLQPAKAKKIQALVYRLGKECGVKVYQFANSGNHLHLVVFPRSRKAFNAYIRALSGIIARISLGVEKGNKLGLQFWDARPFTRILEWGREFQTVCDYVIQNTMEALGFIAYQPRTRKQSRLKSRTQAFKT